MTPRPVDWLWPNRLGLGKVAILEGDPGLGKSFLALDLCARLSAGRPWPDGAPVAAPGVCVYLNGEDGEDDTLRPRLEALGADLGRVFLPDRGHDGLTLPLSLPDHTAVLEAVVARAQARLVVIDPVMQFLSRGVNPSIELSIRRALEPLEAMARRHACHILLLRHLNKKGAGRAVYRGLGAIGLVGVCRSAWLVAEEEAGSSRRVLAQVKNNLAPRQPSLAFEMVPSASGEATLSWLGPVELTADDLLGQGQRRGRRPKERQAAAAFLARVLADGPVAVPELWKQARAEGLPATTLRRARKDLDIRVSRATVDGHVLRYWMFPEHERPLGDRATDDDTGIDEWLRALEKQFPPATPLDEDD